MSRIIRENGPIHPDRLDTRVRNVCVNIGSSRLPAGAADLSTSSEVVYRSRR
jgi:hypothetical protein